MDIRHPLKDLDMQMIEWSVAMNVPVLVLLTKADKLASGARKTIYGSSQALAPLEGDIEVEYFSALKKIGIDKPALS